MINGKIRIYRKFIYIDTYIWYYIGRFQTFLGSSAEQNKHYQNQNDDYKRHRCNNDAQHWTRFCKKDNNEIENLKTEIRPKIKQNSIKFDALNVHANHIYIYFILYLVLIIQFRVYRCHVH